MSKVFEDNQTKNCGFENNSFQSNNQEVKTEKNMLDTLGSLLPFVPMVYEQFTGKKIPQMTGTMAEVQSNINNLALNLQQVSAFQQQILQRLTSLEQNANQQLISLNSKLQNWRLTHEQRWEKKQIEQNATNHLEEE